MAAFIFERTKRHGCCGCAGGGVAAEIVLSQIPGFPLVAWSRPGIGAIDGYHVVVGKATVP